MQVQRTNNSSMVSKRSAATQGYFEDGFLQHLVGKGSRRTPLINRSTLSSYSHIHLQYYWSWLATPCRVLQYVRHKSLLRNIINITQLSKYTRVDKKGFCFFSFLSFFFCCSLLRMFLHFHRWNAFLNFVQCHTKCIRPFGSGACLLSFQMSCLSSAFFGFTWLLITP